LIIRNYLLFGACVLEFEEKNMSKKEKKEKNLLAELEEMKQLAMRTQADFVNYRRRNEEEKATFVRLATSDLMEQLLPVMDNFALAAKHVPETLADNSWVQGVQSIEKQFEHILLTNGLERVESEGKHFDPNLHEAVGEIFVKGTKPGVVVSEQSPGYLLDGKLVRPAKVLVNKVHKGK
jgi:molecular chaperone GrpE